MNNKTKAVFVGEQPLFCKKDKKFYKKLAKPYKKQFTKIVNINII